MNNQLWCDFSMALQLAVWQMGQEGPFAQTVCTHGSSVIRFGSLFVAAWGTGPKPVNSYRHPTFNPHYPTWPSVYAQMYISIVCFLFFLICLCNMDLTSELSWYKCIDFYDINSGQQAALCFFNDLFVGYISPVGGNKCQFVQTLFHL